MFAVFNRSVKFDANIFISDRYMAILLLIWFGSEMPIPAHFGEVFLRVDPLNVCGYCGYPKRHILGQKHAFWHIYCADQSRNATGRVLKKAKKKKRNTKRCDKSHICPNHPPCATHTKVVLRGGVSDVFNHANFYQNRFRGFGSLISWNLPFSYPWHYGLYDRLGLPPSLW